MLPVTELQKKITCLEPKRWTRRWYLLVIVLLYIGLLASFSLNVSLLLRKPAASVSRSVTSEDSDPSSSATAASVTGDETGGEISNNQGRKFVIFDREPRVILYLSSVYISTIFTFFEVTDIQYKNSYVE